MCFVFPRHTKPFLSAVLAGRDPSSAELQTLAAAIAKTSTQFLQFDGLVLGNDGAKLIAEAAGKILSIQRLFLSKCGIGDEGILAIADLLRKRADFLRVQLGTKHSVFRKLKSEPYQPEEEGQEERKGRRK